MRDGLAQGRLRGVFRIQMHRVMIVYHIRESIPV
jgi:hypothetical protein